MELAKAERSKITGRPAADRTVICTVRVPHGLAIKLDAWAASAGMSRAMAIRGLIQAAVGRPD